MPEFLVKEPHWLQSCRKHRGRSFGQHLASGWQFISSQVRRATSKHLSCNKV